MDENTQRLVTAQLLLPDGTVNLNKINLISGAITAPLVRMVYESNAGDVSGVQKMYDIFYNLFISGEYQELYESLKELYADMGYQFEATFALIHENADALVYFLESFLLDYDDILEDYRVEAKHVS